MAFLYFSLMLKSIACFARIQGNFVSIEPTG